MMSSTPAVQKPRRALVTGGSGGIGAAICERLAASGLAVIVHANRGLEKAQALAEKLDGQVFVIIRSASDAGALYGSVTPRDAADVANAEGFAVERRQVVLNAPIKDLGLHKVNVHLHPEVDATVVLNVARSVEEAELQASGKSIQELAAEAEAAAEFEISKLFDDIGAAGRDDDEGVANEG